jgi:secreted PhoX family phosphatase
MVMGAAGMAWFAAGGVTLPARAQAVSAPFNSLHGIGELLPPDDNGIMLPAGFQSRVVARTGQAPVPGSDYLWHLSPDGGACFAADDGGWVYVSNSETLLKGGVGALRFDASGTLVDAYPILENTSLNCAGGSTPWGTWLSCEEHDRGQVYECDPFGVRPAQLRAALGTFKHEAVAVDTVNQQLFLTEDSPDGGFYRFRPAHGLPDLSEGSLDIATIERRGGRDFIVWMPVADPQATNTPTRHQVPGYSPFKGGEGMAFHDGRVYFTTKGDNRVWWYDVTSAELAVLYDHASNDNPILSGVDNVAITPAGDVLVAEDGGDMQIVVLTPDQQVMPLLQIVGHERSEICGPAFDPAHQRLYFSSQRGSAGNAEGGITYEISRI